MNKIKKSKSDYFNEKITNEFVNDLSASLEIDNQSSGSSSGRSSISCKSSFNSKSNSDVENVIINEKIIIFRINLFNEFEHDVVRSNMNNFTLHEWINFTFKIVKEICNIIKFKYYNHITIDKFLYLGDDIIPIYSPNLQLSDIDKCLFIKKFNADKDNNIKKIKEYLLCIDFKIKK